MPAKKKKKSTSAKKPAARKRTSYPKGYKRVPDKKLAAERKKHPNKFPASLVKRKADNVAKRAQKKPGQLRLFE